jgi:hypothetical protein
VRVGAGAERDVGARERDELGDPQPGLNREREYRVVASAGPGALIAGGQQRVDLGLGQVGQQVLGGPFVRDREDPLDVVGVLGVVQREVGEPRVDRREPVVARLDRVAGVALEVVEERGDQRRVEPRDVQLAGRRGGAFGGAAQQQLEGVAVGGDRVRACLALGEEPVGGERL